LREGYGSDDRWGNSTGNQLMEKFDATGGAFTSADQEDRWTYHAGTIDALRSTCATPAVQREAAGYRFEYWIDTSDATSPWYVAVFERNGVLVGFLSFGPCGDVLLANEVAVRKAFRRRGIASAMYSLGEHATQRKFIPSSRASPYGAAFWANRCARMH
jgi:GNAT superfamily N-acetyltransferase